MLPRRILAVIVFFFFLVLQQQANINLMICCLIFMQNYEHKTCYWHDVCAVNDSVIEDEHHITGLFLVQFNRGSRSITLIGQYQGTTLVNKPVALGFSLWWQLFDISKQFCPLVRLGPYLFWSPESECWDIKAIRLLSPLYLRSSTQDPSLIIQ